jgi:hypothetical protein
MVINAMVAQASIETVPFDVDAITSQQMEAIIWPPGAVVYVCDRFQQSTSRNEESTDRLWYHSRQRTCRSPLVNDVITSNLVSGYRSYHFARISTFGQFRLQRRI